VQKGLLSMVMEKVVKSFGVLVVTGVNLLLYFDKLIPRLCIAVCRSAMKG
jgi:hypothetical protein